MNPFLNSEHLRDSIMNNFLMEHPEAESFFVLAERKLFSVIFRFSVNGIVRKFDFNLFQWGARDIFYFMMGEMGEVLYHTCESSSQRNTNTGILEVENLKCIMQEVDILLEEVNESIELV